MSHDWMLQANCRGCGTDLFFNELGDSQTFRESLYVCNGGTRTHKDGHTTTTETKPGCPVKTICLEYALSFPTDQDQYGIFGGCTPNQRDLIRRGRRKSEREIIVEQECARNTNPNDSNDESSRGERDSEPVSAVSPVVPPASSDQEPMPVGSIRGSVEAWQTNLAELLGHLHDLLLPAKPAPLPKTAITS